MSHVAFDEAVAQLSQSPEGFCPEAYQLVNASLSRTLRKVHQGDLDRHNLHVSGKDLCLGFRDYVLAEYGPLSALMLAEWGIKTTDDIGAMVFQLINSGAYSASEQDCLEDFHDVFDFCSAFNAPFQPKSNPTSAQK